METPKEKAMQLIEDFHKNMKAVGVKINSKYKYKFAMWCTEEIIMALYDEGIRKLQFWYDVQSFITYYEEGGK